MKNMFTIKMGAWNRYNNYWVKQRSACQAAIDAHDWKAFDYHLRLMEIAGGLTGKFSF